VADDYTLESFGKQNKKNIRPYGLSEVSKSWNM
jgi:hypothetical protein